MKLLALATLLLFSGQSFATDSEVIWDRYYSRVNSGGSSLHTHFETIAQIGSYDYVETDYIGFTWKNKGQCQLMYKPTVYILEDELYTRSQSKEEYYSIRLREKRVRTRNKSKVPGVWYFEVPAGRAIAAIKVITGRPYNGYLGRCHFRIWAINPKFGIYNR